MTEEKYRKEHIRMFFRFLKEEKAYKMFTQLTIGEIRNRTFHEHLKHYSISLPYFIADCVELDSANKLNVIELDNKWTIFLYENKLYDTPYTCSKKDLLGWLCDILVQAITEKEYNEMTDKAYQILINENYSKKLILQYEEKKN